MGVEVRTGTTVLTADDEGVELRSCVGAIERLDARTTIWPAGAQASRLANALAAQASVEPTPEGRLPLLPDGTLPGHPEVFVVGDLDSLDAAARIRRRLEAAPPRPRSERRSGSRQYEGAARQSGGSGRRDARVVNFEPAGSRRTDDERRRR